MNRHPLWACVVLLSLVAHFPTQAQTAPLNDTGVTQCVSGGVLVACDTTTTGDAAAEPRQDGRFGRDAAATAGVLNKTGGGNAGFDFTKLGADGNPLGIQDVAWSNNGSEAAGSRWSCVHDNVTNLTWEVKTPANMSTIYTWGNAGGYAATVNGASLCGSHASWRLPTRRELLSIVHYGANNPAIDTNYFPNTASIAYWSSDISGSYTGSVLVVGFYDGSAFAYNQSGSLYVRLVRSGQ